MNHIEKIRSLIDYLNEQTHKYNRGIADITDKEWDNKYFELKQLEEVYHIYYPDSPTQSIQYQVVNSLEKVTHNHDMLSLDKTKSPEEVLNFIGKDPYLAMLKMDGLTCSLLYSDGKLVSAETRGDGKQGENILHNARVVKNIPQEIPYRKRLVVDGEIICKLDDFAAFADEYKNTRNFASGSIRLLDSNECAKRNLTFVAWEIIEGLEDIPYLSAKLTEIESYGFTTVPWISEPEGSHKLSFDEINGNLVEKAKGLYYPIDGLVFKFNNWRFGKSLGQTGHHAKNAIAYKFYDEFYETTLKNIEWQVGRSGQITPIAVFEPVDTGDSIIEKASLSNSSILNTALGVPYAGQRLWVSKRNCIIPYIERADKVSEPDDISLYIPSISKCPVCGGQIIIKSDGESDILYCSNPNCEGRILNKLKYFVSKAGLDIKGLSEQTLNKLLDWGWIESAIDIFKLQMYRDDWIKKPGFGVKSVDNILNAIETSRKCDLDKFIAALGIPLVGAVAAKALAKHFGTWEGFIEAIDDDFKFYTLPDFGPEAHSAIISFNYEEANNMVNLYLTFNKVNVSSGTSSLSGLNFVVTGSVELLAKNRDELKQKIENAGGKVVGSVSKNTNYLINNTPSGTSTKNTKAKSLGIPIITEEKFIELFGNLD